MKPCAGLKTVNGIIFQQCTPGSIFRVELDNTHPLGFGFPDYYYTLKHDDAIYDFIKEGGWNVGVLKKDKQVAGFVGSKLINNACRMVCCLVRRKLAMELLHT